MVPPPSNLPESTLIIAPNKPNANKQRRRPAFRPGQRVTKNAAATKKNNDVIEGQSPTTQIEKENSPSKPGTDITLGSTEKPQQRIPAATEEGKSSTQKASQANDASKSPVSDDVKQKEKQNHTKASETTKESQSQKSTLRDGATEGDNLQEQNSNANYAESSKATENVSNKTKVTTKPTKESTINQKKSPPVVAPSKKKSAKKATPITVKKIPSPSATTRTIATAPTTKGRKRKSTGLVVGASRLQAPAPKKRAHQQLSRTNDSHEEEIMPTLGATTATPPTTTTTALVEAPPTPPDIPPPKEGEVALGKFCSKFRIPSSKRKDAAAANGKKKKKGANDNNEDTNNNNNKDSASSLSDKNKSVEPPAAGPVVQIINGEIVLQESSMVVERGGASGLVSANHASGSGAGGGGTNEEDEYAVVEEDCDMAVVGASYNSFVTRKTKPQHWSVDETKLFYEALRQVGTDFLLMSEFYPNRTRKQLKRKYQREMASNPKLVEMALHPSQQKPMDLTVFQVDPKEVHEQKAKSQKQKEADEKQQQQKDANAENNVDATEEDNKQDESDNQEEQTTKRNNSKAKKGQDNGMEVVIEDYGDQENDKSLDRIPVEKTAPTPAVEQPVEEEEEGEPLWPVAHNEVGEEDEVVEEDLTMLEEFHRLDAFDDDDYNGNDIPLDDNPVEEDPESIKDPVDDQPKPAEVSPAVDDKNKTEVAPAPAPATTKEPALSLVPTATKKKNIGVKKPKFRSARPVGRKKK